MIRKTSTKGMTKEQWLEARSHSIGGSEIGAIMGLSPFADAYSVYCEKTGKVPPFEGNLATEVGTALEDFVARKFSEISGLTVNRTNFLWRNDAYPILHASPDRLVLNGKSNRDFLAGLECKTTSAYNATKVHDVDFPAIYYGQCVQYMMVTGIRRWYLAVLVGNSEFHIFGLTLDNGVEKPDWCESMVYVPQSDIDGLWQMAQEFWDRLERKDPPLPVGSDADERTIRKVYADVVPGTMDLYGREKLLQQYMDAKAAADAADKEKKRLEQMIQIEMAGHEDGECIGYKVKWRMQDGRQTFDSKACLARFPECSEFVKVGKPFRKFEVKKL